MFRVDVAPPKGLRAVARDVRRAGNGLPGRLGRELRQPTKKLGEVVRAAILSADLRATRRPGGERFPDGVGNQLPLKRPTAAAVKWSVRVGASPQAVILFNPNKVPARSRALFPYWTGQKRRLRHPVMGNRSAWVSQAIPDVWRQTAALVPAAQSAAARALDETAAIIAGRR